MKSFKSLTALVLCLFLLFSLTSCAVFLDDGYYGNGGSGKGDNGNHNGWYKNKNNPHNPNSTNPGKSKGKSKH